MHKNVDLKRSYQLISICFWRIFQCMMPVNKKSDCAKAVLCLIDTVWSKYKLLFGKWVLLQKTSRTKWFLIFSTGLGRICPKNNISADVEQFTSITMNAGKLRAILLQPRVCTELYTLHSGCTAEPLAAADVARNMSTTNWRHSQASGWAEPALPCLYHSFISQSMSLQFPTSFYSTYLIN